MIHAQTDILQRDRLLVIGPERSLPDMLRRRYPDCEVSTADTFLEGIDKLARFDARAVIAYVEPGQPHLADAVAGLREAAGERARVLLCCETETEPKVRDAAPSGADDYLICPLRDAELDRALGFIEPQTLQTPGASLAELKMLSDVLANLDREPYTVLCKLADLVRLALGSESATIVAEGSAATSGATVATPSLTEPITSAGKPIGQISVGPRRRPYTAADGENLRHYATLVGHMLAAATRQRTWQRRALTDEVSGLPNRRYAMQFLEDLLARARSERFRVTVLLFDVDDFKSFNDSYGHAAGDEIIRCIGKLFKSHCREHDVVTRYGGDEFCVVFWDADQPRVAGSSHPTDALIVLQRFNEALKSYRCDLVGDAAKRITISGGLASFPWDASEPAELIAKADHALLAAKNAGKNQILVFGNPDPRQSEPRP